MRAAGVAVGLEGASDVGDPPGAGIAAWAVELSPAGPAARASGLLAECARSTAVGESRGDQAGIPDPDGAAPPYDGPKVSLGFAGELGLDPAATGATTRWTERAAGKLGLAGPFGTAEPLAAGVDVTGVSEAMGAAAVDPRDVRGLGAGSEG